MAIVADSGAIYGLYDRRDALHASLRAAVETERDTLTLPAPTLGEIDYLLRVRLGNSALLRFLSDIQEGAFVVEALTLADLRRCAALISKYHDLDLGLSDASVVAVAERIGTDRILTVDLRDFPAIRSARGKPFRLLPAERKRSGSPPEMPWRAFQRAASTIASTRGFEAARRLKATLRAEARATNHGISATSRT